jgi:hypothetical protein
VTFDATNPQPVPKNVLHFVNFYQENGFGKRVSPGLGFQGELTNIDLIRDMGLQHTTIDKSPRLHAIVMQKIGDGREEGSGKQDRRRQTETRSAQEQACGRPRRTDHRRPVTGLFHGREEARGS